MNSEFAKRKRTVRRAAFFILASVAGLLALPLLVLGIWLPDVFFAPINTLAQERNARGDTAYVVQYWNHGDFYNTEFVHVSAAGITNYVVLDGDDSKSWRVPLDVDWENRVARVTLGGGRLKKAYW